jgi:peptidoglycan/LPS O-acetylase OafA/YrhL
MWDRFSLRGTRKARQLTERASVNLDMARGVAALAVMAGHVRALFFVAYHDLPHHTVGLAGFYAATTLGHQSVIVFFVLSGFFIVSSIVQSVEDGRWSWRIYLVNRIVRLSLVLIPALVLCCILDHIGMAWASTAALYHRPVKDLIATSVASLETVHNFVGNFFYVQSILVQPFGSDGPLWSLSYEFWYYILFPVALCALTKGLSLTARVVCFCLAILVVCFIGSTISLYFLIWLLGGAIGISSVKNWVQVPLLGGNATAASLPLLCVLGFSVAWPLNSAFLTDAIVALGFGLWIYLLIGMPEKPVGKCYTITARAVAGFSYTLYLVHFPVLFLMRARIIHGVVWQPDFAHILAACGIAAVTIAIAFGMAQITEARTALVRHKVMELLP